MAAFTFYLSVPQDDGSYSEFEDITRDVLESSLSSLKQKLSSNEYDVGSIKFNKITATLRNEKATYSDANNPLSIFTKKRDESILKIDWDRNTNEAMCGSAPCGRTYLSAPIEVYKGLLEDNSSRFDANQQIQKFNFLGLESIIGKTSVDYSALTLGDDVETHIFNLLNQPKITQFLGVQASNISVNLNFTPDSIEPLRNKNVLDAMDELLFLSGAVLYVKDDEIIVSTRDESATSKFVFYGPSSDVGIENIYNVSGFSSGLNRTFNHWTWKDTELVQSFQDSIDSFGFRNKEIESELVTNNVIRLQILSSLLQEFGFPKEELDLTIPMTSPIVNDIFFLDKINIDYPADYRGNEDAELPAVYGTAIYGQDTYIRANSALIIDISENWKVLNRTINTKNQSVMFRIREV